MNTTNNTTENKKTIGQYLFDVFMNEFRVAVIFFGIASLIFFPIANAIVRHDIVYLYIGIGAWCLFGFGLYGIYRNFKPYILSTLCGKTS
jgi:hypothetical protein